MKSVVLAVVVTIIGGFLPLRADVALPGDAFYPGWMRAGRPARFVKADLFNHIDGGAELFLEFGFARVDIQRYRRGQDELELEAYEMESPAAALGIYLMNCGRETAFADIPARNSSEIMQATILKGRYFVQVNNPEGRSDTRPAMAALARALLGSIPEEDPVRLLDALPRESRVQGSERLVRGPVGLQAFYTFGAGDILSLKGEVFGRLADYNVVDGSRFSRLIISYPDARSALAALDHLSANLDAYLIVTRREPTGFLFVDFQKKYGRVELRKETLVIEFKMAAEKNIPVLEPST